MKSVDPKLNRRDFIRKGLFTGIGAGFGVRRLKSLYTYWPENQSAKITHDFRTLGRTGLSVTTVGYGAMRTRDPAVIHRALDLGINYIDTARSYMDGYNEVVVGKVLKTRRSEAYVATKISGLDTIDTTNKLIASVDKSLRALQTDYVDIIQLHNLKSVKQIKNELYMDALQKIKKAGKARYIGFTTHRNEAVLLEAAIPMNFYDIILVKYNFQSPEKLGKIIRDASESGLGIVAMKTQAGGYKDHKMGNLSPHQAALRWVFQNSGVTTAIPSMTTYGQLDENIHAMGSSFSWGDRKILHRYSQAIEKRACRLCDACQKNCPYGVDVFEVNRCLMYLEGYDDEDLARRTFHQMNEQSRPVRCSSCRDCAVRCVNGLDIRMRMVEAERIFC